MGGYSVCVRLLLIDCTSLLAINGDVDRRPKRFTALEEILNILNALYEDHADLSLYISMSFRAVLI